MARTLSLLILLVFIMALQTVFLREAFFGSSQGGAQVQLAASRPVYYGALVPM